MAASILFRFTERNFDLKFLERNVPYLFKRIYGVSMKDKKHPLSKSFTEQWNNSNLADKNRIFDYMMGCPPYED